MLTPDEIQSNFDKFRSLFLKLEEDRVAPALALIDHFSTRLAIAPASSRQSFHAAYPGGLVDHSLRVLKNALILNSSFGWDLPKPSLIIGSLFHDLGKLGGVEETQQLYVDAEDWKKQKYGELYQFNYDIPFMSVPHRGVFLCQHFGLKLTHDEMLAILLNDGFVVPGNQEYCLKEPKLATCVMTADYIATRSEKNSEIEEASEKK